MKRVIFFVDAEWSMGRFHSDLIKYLFKEGVESQLISYTKGYTWQEMHEQMQITDYFISNGSGISTLITSYNIPPEKCILILLHPVDIQDILRSNIDHGRLAKIATVAEWIIPLCGVFKRDISIVKFGINTKAFQCHPSTNIKTIGYGAAFHTREETEYWKSIDLLQPKISKRGYLVREIAEEMNLNFKSAHPDRCTYVTMPGFYNSVDVVICASTDEGAGGPVLEGGVAGRLIITTATGGFDDLVTKQGADVVPVNEKDFKEETKKLLNYYIDNPSAYQERCRAIQDYAIKRYDLANSIHTWLDLIYK